MGTIVIAVRGNSNDVIDGLVHNCGNCGNDVILSLSLSLSFAAVLYYWTFRVQQQYL